MKDDSEIYEAYKAEVGEILTEMRRSFETLKKRPDIDALNDLTRSCHKLKGAAGMMEYSHVEELAKGIETLSKVLANREAEFTQETLRVLLEAFDLLKKYTETDFDERDPALLEKLRKLGAV
jgi:two-component system chemotaxis sensor kinase CheA